MIRIASALALLAALITPAHAGGYASALAVSGDACATQGLCVAEQVQVQQYAVPVQQQVVRQYVQPVQQLQQVRVIQRVVQVPQYVQQQAAVGYSSGVSAQAQAFSGGYGGGQQVVLQQSAPRRGLFGLGGGKQVSKSFSKSKTVTRGR